MRAVEQIVSILAQRLADIIRFLIKTPHHAHPLVIPGFDLDRPPETERIQQEDLLVSCGNYKKASGTCSSVAHSLSRSPGTFNKGQLQSC